MSTVGYSIVGLLVGLGIVLAAVIVGGLWFAVSSLRPELLERPGRDGG